MGFKILFLKVDFMVLHFVLFSDQFLSYNYGQKSSKECSTISDKIISLNGLKNVKKHF
jgi:hypothetical protein